MNDLLNPQEVGDILGLTSITIKRMAKRGDIPGTRINKRGDWRFKREDIENYLDGQQQIHNDLDK